MFDIELYERNKGRTIPHERYLRDGILCGYNLEQNQLILGYPADFEDAWTRDDLEESDQVDPDYLFSQKLITFNYINHGVLQG